MKLDRTTAGLVRDADGSFSAGYGPYALRTAFQPIFSRDETGEMEIQAVEALLRPFKAGEPVSPGQFFPIVEPADLAAVESLSRRLHLVNMGNSAYRDRLLFLNFNPQAFAGLTDMQHEADELARLAGYLNIAPTQIVCEIIEKHVGTRSILLSLVETLRSHGFTIAIDDYGAEGSDSDRVELVKPEIVKFDALWAHRFLETSEGFKLLRTMVAGFSRAGITTLFEGLEEHWQVSTCRELGPCLLQGFALAVPELAVAEPDVAAWNSTPAGPAEQAAHAAAVPGTEHAEPAPRFAAPHGRRHATFGRRGR